MKFNNCAAWAKGWYKQRKNVSAWWMDLAHCINIDGWIVYSKKDVASWCLARFDEEPEFFKKGNCRFGFSNMAYHFNRYDSLYDNLTLEYEDKVILYFKDCLSTMPKTAFENGGYKPSKCVLPLYLREPWYDDGSYSTDHKPTFHFGEMNCDAENRIDEMFSDLPKQESFYSFIDDNDVFDYIESSLERKNWKDVVTDLGAEVGCFVYYATGEDLRMFIAHGCIDADGEEETYTKLGRYEHSNGFDVNKTYRLYIKSENVLHIWGYEKEHTLMKIEEV